jgi:hypothetical protein
MVDEKQYVPEALITTREEAISALENLPLKIFSKLKGRILSDIEMALPTEDSRLTPLKNSVGSQILTVTKYMKDRIELSLSLLKE